MPACVGALLLLHDDDDNNNNNNESNYALFELHAAGVALNWSWEFS